MKSIDEKLQSDFLKLLIEGNRLKCAEFIQNCSESGISIFDIYEKILKDSMYKVGELWEYNKISVATEHLASAIVEAILNDFYSKIISKEKTNKTVIVACVESEFHQIGVKMISDVFEKNGWNAFFLGSNTPTNDLMIFIRKVKPDLIAISLSIYFHFPILEEMIQRIRNEFPETLILVGGQAFLHGGIEIISNYKNVIYQPDINSTELFINTLNFHE